MPARRPATLRHVPADPAVLLGVCVALLVIVAVVTARTHAQPVGPLPALRQFASTIDGQYHECVPLGWFPDSRPWRAYFPGYNANVADKDALFQALWVGVVPARTLDDRHAIAVKTVLDELTRLGLLVRHDAPGSFRYTLTYDGERYYYERDRLGNNAEGWSYLCFSRLRTKDVTWTSPPHSGGEAYRNEVIGRIRFTWESSEDAPWVTPFLKAHAIELNPTSSPAEATAVRYSNGKWTLAEFDFASALVEDPSAWSPSR